MLVWTKTKLFITWWRQQLRVSRSKQVCSWEKQQCRTFADLSRCQRETLSSHRNAREMRVRKRSEERDTMSVIYPHASTIKSWPAEFTWSTKYLIWFTGRALRLNGKQMETFAEDSCFSWEKDCINLTFSEEISNDMNVALDSCSLILVLPVCSILNKYDERLFGILTFAGRNKYSDLMDRWDNSLNKKKILLKFHWDNGLSFTDVFHYIWIYFYNFHSKITSTFQK